MGLMKFLTKVGNFVMGQGFTTDADKEAKRRREEEAAAVAAKVASEQAAMLGGADALRRLRLARGMQSTMLSSLTTLPVPGSGGRKALLGE